MFRYIFSILVSLIWVTSTTSQKLFTQMLAEKSSKGACVVIRHSSLIDSLVNGLVLVNTEKQLMPGASIINDKVGDNTFVFVTEDSLKFSDFKQYKKAEGYRIQIYTGANSRKDKETAMKFQEKFKDIFPDVEAYVTFISPRWVVRVGDFVNREDAVAFIGKIQEAAFTHEARVVKSVIQIPIY